jgi:fucose permease
MASILAAATALGRFTAGIVLRRFDWYRVLTTGLLLAAVLVLVALPMSRALPAEPVTSLAGAPLAAFVFPLIGFCLAPVYPAINSVILSALPKHQHAAMAGLIVVFSALGGTSGSIITGYLFEHLGGRTAFYFSLVPIAAILASLAVFKRKSVESGPYEGSADVAT